MQRISRFRMIVFIVIILAMIGVFSLRLYKTQAVVTEESLVAADADSMTYQSTVEAARGNILDRPLCFRTRRENRSCAGK